MENNKKGFSLVELIITLFITSILLIIIGGIYPKMIETFSDQKGNLEFQQSFVLDSFYVNNIIKNSNRVIDSYSSGKYNRINSCLTLLNEERDYHYSTIYLGDDTGNIDSEGELKINVKNNFLYSDFTKVGDDIYFTNPGNHTIEKYVSGALESTTIYGNSGEFGYQNTGSGKFNTPTGITNDGTYLYVSDSGNNVIRKINISSGEIEKLLGNESNIGFNSLETYSTGTIFSDVLFNYPTSIYYDNNFLYISDTFNNRVRKIDLLNDKVYTIAGGEDIGFNLENGQTENVNINYPLALTKVNSGIIFSDTLNGKIRFLNDSSKEIKTLVGLETQKDLISEFSKYNKDYFVSKIQSYSSGFYYNDLSLGIIYDYNYGDDLILGTTDDNISNIFGNINKNMVINGDFENSLANTGVYNDILVDDDELFFSSSNDDLSPIFGDKYLVANTYGKTASGILDLSSNPSDGDLFQIQDKIFEFDNNLSVTTDFILLPIGSTSLETLENLTTELDNYGINYTQSGTSIKIFSQDIGDIGNNISFSGTLILEPSSGKLAGGIEYLSGIFSFYFFKNLILGEKYKLSFYMSSSTDVETEVLSPLLTIKAGTGNIEQKVLNSTNKWTKKEFIFDGTGRDERFEFLVKYGQKLYFDKIELVSFKSVQNLSNLENKENIDFGILNSFFIDFGRYFLPDLENKKIYILNGDALSTISGNFLFFDKKTFKNNFKNDYLGTSLIDTLNFGFNTVNSIMYKIGRKDYIIKLSNNIGNNYETNE